MRRPSAAREALRFSPLVEAGWANTSRVERVPSATAGAEPLVFFAGRPPAQRAADTRRLRLSRLLIVLKLSVWSNDRIVRNGSHAQLL